jgi:DNA-binding NtrC family response regulator
MREQVLVVDDEIGMRSALDATLRRGGWQVETASGVEEALRKFESGRHSLIVTDMRMGDGDGLQVMQRVRQLQPAIPVILLTAYGTIPEAVDAMKAGACDYLTKPVSTERLYESVDKLLRSDAPVSAGTPFIGSSPVLLRALEHARMAAKTTADILVEAESGTGKELLARYIHQHSRHSSGPFVAVNCAALPEALLESELFGHAQGAFTGALNTKKGRFELADGGTLLLDEIGEMPLSLQPKLLRVLQERKVEHLGGLKTISFNTRVIATTNRSLAELMRQGTFRADLYFRLNVIPLSLPPLRERGSDVIELAQHFGRTLSDASEPVELTPEFLDGLSMHSWPGNVRELANTIRRALVFSDAKTIGPEWLDFCNSGRRDEPKQQGATMTRDEADRRLFQTTLVEMRGNRTRTAAALGVSVRTVRNKIRAYGLRQEMPA